MNAVDVEALRVAWGDALKRCDTQGVAGDEIFADLIRRYSEPARHYHTVTHLLHVVGLLGQAASPAVLFAAFFHDVVYDSRASDNEARSAEYAEEALRRLGSAEAVRAETTRLILLTRTHDPRPEDVAGQTLIDADLAILGSDPAEYASYAAAIRREYHWVPDADYRAGRRRVLEGFLLREHIYYLPATRQHREAQARINLANEIAGLASCDG